MRYAIQSPRYWLPDWANHAVFYHLYPLGFLDAPPQNDLEAQPVPRLAGLRDWYDHLERLGVTAIYLGPVFESGSHGYDTVDYFAIDRRLGDMALFRQLLDELHGRGLRVILDGVFNHTGRGFFAFQDILKNGRNSQYQSWYHINWAGNSSYGDGFAYESWEGHEALPKLNLANPDVRSYLFEVARMWLVDVGIDGWRLDVAYELPIDFLWEFRRTCKEVRPDCFLLGETIRGDYRTWVAPDLLDAGTDYQLYESLVRSFNDGNFADLRAGLDRARHVDYGLYKELALVNFLSNHDVTRIRSRLKDERHVYPALILLLTTPGIPALYYGDEVGMRGRKEDGDPALRRPMPQPADWPEYGADILRETLRLVRLRHEHHVFADGRYASLYGQGPHFAFLRAHTREIAVVAINADDAPVSLTLPVREQGIVDGTVLHDVLNPHLPGATVEGGQLVVDEVPPNWGRVLVASW